MKPLSRKDAIGRRDFLKVAAASIAAIALWLCALASDSSEAGVDIPFNPSEFGIFQASPGAVVSGTSTSTLLRPENQWNAKGDQRRVWWNSYQSRWDGVLPITGTTDESDWHVFKDITGSPTKHLETDTRATSVSTVQWDDTGKLLHVWSGHISSSRYYRISYNDSTDTYSIVSGYPTTITGLNYHNTGDNTSAVGADHSIAGLVSSNGYVWASVMRTDHLFVQRSTDNGATWLGAPIELVAAVNAIGQTALVNWTNAGTTYVGVFGTEDAGNSAYFFYIDETTADIAVGNWTDDSANIPAYGNSDDHLGAVVHDNIQYFITKAEEAAGGGEDLLILLKRTAAGTWSSTVVWLSEATASDEQSRPTVSIDTTNDEIYVISHHQNDVDATVQYKKASLDSLGDLPNATPVEIIGASGKAMNNIVAPSLATSASDLLVLANNITDETIWSVEVTLAAPSTGASYAYWY